MPRNSGGDYSLPAGNPVVTATPITIAWANGTLDDLADAMTESLSRDGEGGMLAALELIAGDVNAPGLGFSAEPALGLYRAAAGELGFASGGTKVLSLTAAGAAVTGTLAVSGAVALAGALNVVGNFSVATNKLTVAAASGNTAVAGTLAVVGQTTLAGVTGTVGYFSSTLGVAGASTFGGQCKGIGVASSAGVPTWAFDGFANTGMFLAAPSAIGFSTNGTNVFSISTTNVTSDLPLVLNSTLSVATTSTFTGVATFTAQPIRGSAGAFLYNVNAANSVGAVTISNEIPASAAAVGSPGAMRFVYA